MEAIEVLDSAVKIGLGALISGIGAYIITRKDHSNEREKEFREKKSQILQYAVENIEPYFHALQTCLDIIDGVLRQGTEPGLIDDALYEELGLKSDDDALIATRDKKNIAVSRLKLIGLTELSDTLLNILVIEKEFRDHIHFEHKIPSDPVLNEICVKYYRLRNKFYSQLESEFRKIYS